MDLVTQGEAPEDTLGIIVHPGAGPLLRLGVELVIEAYEHDPQATHARLADVARRDDEPFLIPPELLIAGSSARYSFTSDSHCCFVWALRYACQICAWFASGLSMGTKRRPTTHTFCAATVGANVRGQNGTSNAALATGCLLLVETAPRA